jgi:hypothetical protein
MGIRLVLAGLGLPLVAGGLALSTLGVAAAVVGMPAPAPGASGPPGRPAGPPADLVGLYATAAAGTCPALPWAVLAAIGTIESDNGASQSRGVHSGANYAGAEGPMQFEPATFAEYDLPVPLGGVDPPSPYDQVDAVWAAARLLCADGAGAGHLAPAIFAYNHSAAYVAEVLALAAGYSFPAPPSSSSTGTGPASTR